MDVILVPLLKIVFVVIDLYIWAIVISMILSWLVAFNVVNRGNRLVAMVGDVLYRITEPLLGPIRRVLPDMGAVDLSPMVLILILWFVEGVLQRLAIRLV
ncbi:MAG: YggT family protein [Rhodospirillales bacterium]|nr:YggT family protein [Rhodospirillales bacterium]